MLEIFFWILLFIVSYMVIYFSADIFLDNLKLVCEIYKLSPFIVALLVFGIDPEESIASIIAASNSLAYLSMGNVIGNSIIAMTLPFSIPTLISPLKFKSISRFFFILIYSLMLIVLIGFLFNEFLIISGILALLGYVLYFIRNLKRFRRGQVIDILKIEEETAQVKFQNVKKGSKIKKIILVILGLIFIIIGGEFLVISAENIITLLNIPEAFFGFIIVGFVTNAEEITLVLKSIKKKSVEVGLGAMIGKLIWNLSITFGISGIILINIDFNWILVWNWLLLILIIYYFNHSSKKGKMGKKEGGILLLMFVIFVFINTVLI